jgi:ABC-type transport system involved in multi-copper enzyme maturation permease subunit
MLPELLRREWILHRTTIWLMFAIFGAYQIYAMISMNSSRGWVVMATIYAAGLTLAIFVREDKFRATAWSCSLPISRRELVRARFVFAWLMVLAALVVSTLMTLVVPGSKVSVMDVLQPTTLLIVAAVATMVFAWVLPFTIRFGMIGIMIFLVGGQVLGVVFLLVAQTLKRGSASNERPIRAFLASISESLVASREALTPLVFAITVILILAAINWSAYRFSAFLFQRKEL